ncbi:hypothetical protein BN3590_04497 [Clostridium sp. C105KSO15]|nr:hypothetical protein BN3590_04497 [Clostridium sp. C105KSO15]
MSRIYSILIKTLFLAAFLIAAFFLFSRQISGEAAADSYIPSEIDSEAAEGSYIAPEMSLETTSDSYISSEISESVAADMPQEGRYDVMLDSASGPLTYYNQGDSRWANFLYGGKDPLSTYGCGPTVMAMLITSFTGTQVLPTDVATWAAQNKSWCPGQGSYHRLIVDSSSAYGLKATPLKDYTVQGLQNALDSGHLVVALMKKGHFTRQGHFIIITRSTGDGKFRIADPNNYDNTKFDWESSLIFQELNYQSGNGGPLWIIGLPDSAN